MKLESIDISGVGVCSPQIDLLNKIAVDGIDIDRNQLPASVRRRTSIATRLAVTAAYQATRQAAVDPTMLPSVFASVGGEIQVTDQLCRTLTEPHALVSPTQFHNSVHNTTVGYWSIINKCQQPTTAIAAAPEDNLAIALLEIWSQLYFNPGPMLLVCYDEVWPQYLAAPVGKIPFACAFVLQASGYTKGRLGSITFPQPGKPNDELINPYLRDLIRQAPAAMAVPLIRALQQAKSFENLPLSVGAVSWNTHVQSDSER